jgi:hypothetical protein
MSGQIASNTIMIAPQGHSAAHNEQPFAKFDSAMFTWRTRCGRRRIIDIVTTAFSNSRGQGTFNDKAARRHQSD